MQIGVMMLDRLRTEIAVTCENQYVPYGRRVVFINLTPEQEQSLIPREVGKYRNRPQYEQYGEVWLEDE